MAIIYVKCMAFYAHIQFSCAAYKNDLAIHAYSRSAKIPMCPAIAYGHKLATVQWKPKETILVIDSSSFVEAFRSMFWSVWENANQEEPEPMT